MSSNVKTIDIDEPISDIQIRMGRDVSDALTLSSRVKRTHRQPFLEVRVILERFSDPALARELYALESHLQKGGFVGFSVDRDKTWASGIGHIVMTTGDTVIDEGDTAFNVYGDARVGAAKNCNLFKHYEASGIIAGGDVLALDGVLDEYNHEEVVAKGTPDTIISGARASGTVAIEDTQAGGVRYPYKQGSIVRYRDFWPYLQLPEKQVGKPIITHDHRVSWTFDAVFEYRPVWMAATQRAPKGSGQAFEREPTDIFDDPSIGGVVNGVGTFTDGFEYTGIGSSIRETILKY
jgi:hypothetical protein